MRICVGIFFICFYHIIINISYNLLCTTLYIIFKLLNGNSIETDVGLEKIYKKNTSALWYNFIQRNYLKPKLFTKKYDTICQATKLKNYHTLPDIIENFTNTCHVTKIDNNSVDYLTFQIIIT